MHYRFISEREFRARAERGEFLEWAEVHGNLYGTLRGDVDAALERGYDVILEIDVQGAAEVKGRRPESVLIFIEPPSMTILEERLRHRRSEQEEEVQRRMANAYDELRRKDAFDGVVINDVIDRAVEEVLQLMDRVKERGS